MSDELAKRINELENTWFRLKATAAIAAAALAVFIGVSYVQIPRRAVAQAEEMAKTAAKDMAIKVAEEKVPEEVTKELERHKTRANNAADVADAAKNRVLEIEKKLNGTEVKLLHDRLDGLAVRWGSPAQWECGPKEKRYTAPTSGVVLVSNRGEDYGFAKCSVSSDRQRVVYQENTDNAVRGISHMIPAEAGEVFTVWGTETIKVHFIPITVAHPTTQPQTK